MTREGDVVLVHIEGKPAFFARIENIAPDPKPDWWQVKMLVLQVPLITVTWILREAYINGEEFTMGGHPMRLVKVEAPAEDASGADREAPGRSEGAQNRQGSAEQTTSNVVSLRERKLKKKP
ncbi:hypothetical protein [Desulfosoma caldarium]|uniref:Uncharacterized protein n=1 Tax=Desulfosoma caldarium TaxID=610254 RepID=A0A3N1URH2_9BACT|nr:hypothetical protein [Desulfosoma caldarium]ROQ92328.1 hypothetical protein EDC27_2033 [Desulfosoma caldarium]